MSDYLTNMDPDYYFGKVKDEAPKPDPDFSLKRIGSSKWLHGQDTDPIRAVSGEIRMGAGHIELTAPGQGRGEVSQPTFENIDKDQREAIRDIQRAVDVSMKVA